MRIACARCQKMVDNTSIERKDTTTIITAYCHGEKDSMTLTDDWIKSDPEFAMLIQSGMVLGWAFQKKD